MTTLAQTYQKKTDKQHVLDNPDTYIGSIENVETTDFNLQSDPLKMKQETFHLIPGLYKLFDEGVVNCRDHVIRMSQKKEKDVNQVSYISIEINQNTITLTNDGDGIDVAQHPEHKIWIPEMIFGHLRTSTNYDKTEKKIVGGKNGFGFKLVLIWSTWGQIETIDHRRKLKYIQTFENNLDVIHPPKVTKCSNKPYTKVSFKPDLARFGIENISEAMIRLFQKRTYDIAGITEKNIKVKYNKQLIPIKGFEQYVDLYIGSKSETSRSFEQANERWSYAICLTPNDEFVQVSFVNGICTLKGGRHVEYITNQIIKKLCAVIKKKKKMDVKSSAIKEQLMIFVNCTIENPAFESQTKDYLNTPVSKFGSSAVVSDKFIDKIAKMGVINTACALTEVKDNKDAKKTDGSKTKSIRGIPKLVDANFAGTTKSNECTIIFCEGDSAKAGIVSGLSKEDRNFIGIYPMKGKLLNVRGETSKRIYENKEIIEIKKIIGLENSKSYTQENLSSLRYGKVIFMTDQDLDGIHIKGLGLNMFQSEWYSLSKIPNFIGFMNTPILKATKGQNSITFYNEGEYEEWKQVEDQKGWKVKYYKGLGTSTSKEFKEYFKRRKLVYFVNDEKGDDIIDMVFNKKRANDRKIWLGNYNRTLKLDTAHTSVSYTDFVDKEMIHFSKYDNDRSIPNILDGLKKSLRKILFSAFKKNLTTEIKVAQFSGYVSEHSGYHHGEASLNGAIVNMAQNYVGSNNINLFMPNGQFGTRLQGGKDSASERYIFTMLNPATRLIYLKQDDPVYDYIDDDGQIVEPIFYAPIIPMILVNGSKGIGTGFSTDIPSYNPKTIISKIKFKLGKTSENPELVPYYKNFTGIITKVDTHKYICQGVYEKPKENYIKVTELPIGIWTDDYKQYIEGLIDKKNTIKDYTDMSTESKVDVTIQFYPGVIAKLESKKLEYGCNDLEKTLKLVNTINTNNMHMFDENERLKKFDNVEDIINHYFKIRLDLYDKRKQYQIKQLIYELMILENKYKYIEALLNDDIDLRKKSNQMINEMMTEKQFNQVEDSFNYLIKMSMDSVSEENVDKLKKEYKEKQEQLKLLESMKINDIWFQDLLKLEKELEQSIKIKIKIKKNV
jgi:DNA topoisomerase II